MNKFKCLCIAVFILLLMGACGKSAKQQATSELTGQIPEFNVDPFWPKPLPENWLLGQVAGIAVDKEDNIWIIHRPRSLGENEGGPDWKSYNLPYSPAPPVVAFDPEGNVLKAWGGAGEGYDWPDVEHGIYVDHKNNVWVGGSGANDHQVLKFTVEGRFLLQIGKPGKTGGSNDTTLLGRPTEYDVDPVNNEIYIADGYLNKRVIVFDASDGKYKRHWGAYGRTPDDSKQDPYDPAKPPSEQFGEVTHAIRISNDNLVYVCDRSNNRIQVFQKNGTFVFEEFIARNTLALGSAWDIDFSDDPGQKFAYLADGTNQCVWILQRKDLKTLERFGSMGRYAGQFIWIHNLAADSKGNIYTAEVLTGKRVQKFTLTSYE